MLSYTHLPGHHLTLCHYCSHNPQYNCDLLMPSVNQTASRTSRSLISADTLYLIPPRTLLCLQEWMMQMTKTLPLQECIRRYFPCRVPVPNTTVVTNADDNLDAESNHNSVDPNEATDNSSKAYVHSTGSHISVHSTTSEPPQHLLDEEDNLSKD